MKKLLEETLDPKFATKFEKIEADINELKEHAAAQQAAIKRLEQAGAFKAHVKDVTQDDNFSSQADDCVKHLKLRGAKLKFHKLEFPTFDGKEDPLPWLTRVEQSFKEQGMKENISMAVTTNLWHVHVLIYLFLTVFSSASNPTGALRTRKL